MPNWCGNDLYVTGKVKDLRRFDEQFKKPSVFYGGYSSTIAKADVDGKTEEEVLELLNERGFGNDKILAFKCTPYKNPFGTDKDREESYDLNVLTSEDPKEGYSFNNFIKMKREDFLEGWYEWSNANWGTKWDCCEMYAGEAIDPEFEDDREDSFSLSFETAWGPAIPVVDEMARQYPELRFEYTYEEGGMCFAGIREYEDGECTVNEEAEDGKYREFMRKHFDREYLDCKGCGALLEEWEIYDNEGICPECGSKEVYDGDTIYEYEPPEKQEETKILN